METAKEFIASLPDDRRKAITNVQATILKNLPEGFVETCDGKMLNYEVSAKVSPATDGKPLTYTSLASQKDYMAIYFHSMYANAELRNWFIEAYKATGKQLDIGQSCVRFRTLDDLLLEVVGEMIARTSVEEFIEIYPWS